MFTKLEFLLEPAYFVPILISLISSYIIYKLSRNRVELKIYYEHLNEFSKLKDADPKIKVFYQEREVQRVTTTRVWFWNGGRRVLRKEDIPENEIISLSLHDKEENYNKLEILDYKLLKSSRESIKFGIIDQDIDRLAIFFNDIDKEEGALIEIQHSGSMKTTLSFKGTILGPKAKTQIRGNLQYSRFRKKTKLTSFIALNFRQVMAFSMMVLGTIGGIIFNQGLYHNTEMRVNKLSNVSEYYQNILPIFENSIILFEKETRNLCTYIEIIQVDSLSDKNNIKNEFQNINLDSLKAVITVNGDSISKLLSELSEFSKNNEMKSQSEAQSESKYVLQFIILFTVYILIMTVYLYFRYPRYPRELHIY
jgi:hypothetical protein